MALTLTAGRGAVTFLYSEGNMTASWTVETTAGEENLITTMKKVIAFVEGEEEKPALPERIPGFALGMAQTAHPAPVGNGWAATAGVVAVAPELPPDRQGEWEMIPPEEQG